MEAVAANTAEESVIAMIGSSYSGGASAAPVTEPTDAPEIFDFDAEFQTKVASFVCRDDEFMRRMAHLIKPEYFENAGEAALVNITLRHFAKYRCVPDKSSMAMAIREDIEAKIIRRDIAATVVGARKEILAHELLNREFVEDKVVQFVRHQAVSHAILKSVDLLTQKKFPQIESEIKAAIEVGISEEGDAYDYFGRIQERTNERLDAASGKRPPQGITTGIGKMDEVLHHKGWGRKELATIMGGAKSGKTTALINFAKAASLARHNVLYVTLEVGALIISDRMDASISETMMKELSIKIHGVREKVEEAKANAGNLIIHEFASGTMSADMLRKLIERYKSPGRNFDGSIRPPIRFDMVVVDYADIMKPNHRTDNPIENSKSVYVDLRAIAFDENVAMLTATQTNREGHKAVVATATHVADDFNKVRTVDLMISINKTDEEARDNIARLYFAASRNQESGFTIVVKQDLACMRFVTAVLRIE